MLIPQSSLLFPNIIAEHFLDLPCLGLFFIVGIILEKLKDKRPALARSILAAGIVYYSLLAAAHSSNWRTPLGIYKWTARLSPRSHKIHYCLGNYYIQHGLLSLGLQEYLEASRLDANFVIYKIGPDYLDKALAQDKYSLSVFYHNLGVILSRRARFAQAEAEFKKSLEFNPGLIQAYNDLGCLYLKVGELTKAEVIFNDAIKINPDFTKLYYNLGVVYVELGQAQKAIACWARALEVEPGYDLARVAIKRLKNEK
jgi:tetratricopeptide (TPR) repeat protein